MWRGELLTVVSNYHGSHIFPHASVKCQHAVNVVGLFRVFDVDCKGEFVVGVTGFATGGVELGSREIAVQEQILKRLVTVALVFRPRPVACVSGETVVGILSGWSTSRCRCRTDS